MTRLATSSIIISPLCYFPTKPRKSIVQTAQGQGFNFDPQSNCLPQVVPIDLLTPLLIYKQTEDSPLQLNVISPAQQGLQYELSPHTHVHIVVPPSQLLQVRAFWVLAFCMGFFKSQRSSQLLFFSLWGLKLPIRESNQKRTSAENLGRSGNGHMKTSRGKEQLVSPIIQKTVRSKPKEAKLHKLSNLNDLTALG